MRGRSFKERPGTDERSLPLGPHQRLVPVHGSAPQFHDRLQMKLQLPGGREEPVGLQFQNPVLERFRLPCVRLSLCMCAGSRDQFSTFDGRQDVQQVAQPLHICPLDPQRLSLHLVRHLGQSQQHGYAPPNVHGRSVEGQAGCQSGGRLNTQTVTPGPQGCSVDASCG